MVDVWSVSAGLDIGWRSRQDRAKALGRSLEKLRFVNGVRTTYLSDILCEAGRFGRKTGTLVVACTHVQANTLATVP